MTFGEATGESLVVGPPRVDARGLATVLRFDGTEHELAYAASRPVSPAVGDVLLCATLLPAMALGGDLHIPAPVSCTLLEHLEDLQRVFSVWLPGARSVRVTTDGIAAELPRGASAASFFSGGVDSFYTVLRNLDRIDTLIFLRGFDLFPSKPQLTAMVTERVRTVAAELGKDLIEIDISGREFTGHSIDGTNPLLPWLLYCGSFLGSVAHLLAGQVGTVLVPSSGWLYHPVPHGSQLLTDRLWGSSSVRVVHDGAETLKADKVRYLADFDVAMRNLRVCWESPDQEYNCGRCRKCVMTMVGLSVAGALGRCTSMPASLDPAAFDRVGIANDNQLGITLSYLRALEESDVSDRWLIDRFRSMIADYYRGRAEQYLSTPEPRSRERPRGSRLVNAVDGTFARFPRARDTARRIARRFGARRPNR